MGLRVKINDKYSFLNTENSNWGEPMKFLGYYHNNLGAWAKFQTRENKPYFIHASSFDALGRYKLVKNISKKAKLREFRNNLKKSDFFN